MEKGEGRKDADQTLRRQAVVVGARSRKQEAGRNDAGEAGSIAGEPLSLEQSKSGEGKTKGHTQYNQMATARLLLP